jgi:hypothetical protein
MTPKSSLDKKRTEFWAMLKECSAGLRKTAAELDRTYRRVPKMNETQLKKELRAIIDQAESHLIDTLPLR